MIHRCKPHPTPYQIIGKNLINNEQLSLKALGMMVYLLGRPDNWEVKVCQLARHFKRHKETISKILKELEQLGYARLVSVRRDGESKLHGKQWEIFESPELNPDHRTELLPFPEPLIPRQSEKPDVGENRRTEKPALRSKEEKGNKEFHLKNKECEKERAEGTIHPHFLKIDDSLNEKNCPFPPGSAAPPFPAAAAPEFLFNQSKYVTDPHGFDLFCSDLLARGEHYDQADLDYYYRRIRNWSDSKNVLRSDWIAAAAGIIESDHAQNKLKISKTHGKTTIDGLDADKVLRRAANLMAKHRK